MIYLSDEVPSALFPAGHRYVVEQPSGSPSSPLLETSSEGELPIELATEERADRQSFSSLSSARSGSESEGWDERLEAFGFEEKKNSAKKERKFNSSEAEGARVRFSPRSELPILEHYVGDLSSSDSEARQSSRKARRQLALRATREEEASKGEMIAQQIKKKQLDFSDQSDVEPIPGNSKGNTGSSRKPAKRPLGKASASAGRGAEKEGAEGEPAKKNDAPKKRKPKKAPAEEAGKEGASKEAGGSKVKEAAAASKVPLGKLKKASVQKRAAGRPKPHSAEADDEESSAGSDLEDYLSDTDYDSEDSEDSYTSEEESFYDDDDDDESSSDEEPRRAKRSRPSASLLLGKAAAASHPQKKKSFAARLFDALSELQMGRRRRTRRVRRRRVKRSSAGRRRSGRVSKKRRSRLARAVKYGRGFVAKVARQLARRF